MASLLSMKAVYIMNHIYQSIWNARTGTFVAASENARSNGAKSSRGAGTATATASFTLKALAAALMLAFGSAAYANPTGGVVSAGSAGIAGSAGTMTVTQTTQNVAINWQTFNVGQAESVRFVQPNSSSVALNRVLGPDPSSILGSLTANGKVFLVNPNGVLFGRGASVNVAGLVASTLGISDANFMAGKYSFAGAGAGSVVNEGSINANGGYVALLGANVDNQGLISAQLGTVALAAGNAVTLDVAGDGLLNVMVNEGAMNALVRNGGLIQADGGQVVLSAQAAGNLLQTVVNNTGVIRAQTLDTRNGIIRLLGDMQSGTVNIGGTLDASGTASGQTGGNITATGQHVGLFDTTLNVSGDAGGGTVLIGGGYQGANAAVPNAQATYMSADAKIIADAITRGDGGTVVLWSDGSTKAYGTLSARGGSQSGNGGLIETSGHYLDVAGISVNTSATAGNYGNWLLDPADVTITGAATSPPGIIAGVFTPGPGVSAANVAVADIQTALLTTGVTINTANTGAPGVGAGDITIGTPIVAAPITWATPTTLTLNAVGNVLVNTGSTITGTNGSLIVNAGGNITSNATTTTTTGSIQFTAGGNLALNDTTTVTTGNVTALAGGTVTVAAPITVTTGDIILRGDNDGTGPGVPAGTVAVNCVACLTITTGTVRVRFNPASYATTLAEIAAYNLKIAGGAGLDAKAWVFGQGDNKVYDGTRAAVVAGLKPDTAGVQSGATIGAVTNALFDTKHVGTSKLITYDSTFADATFDLFAPFGTPLGSYTTRADITVRPLTVAAVTETRVYNGTTSSVGVPTVTGLQVGDVPIDVLNGPLTQAFTSKNVQGVNGSTLVATGPYTVADGNGGNNYAITVLTAPGTITPLALVGSITAANKQYDGNNTATITGRSVVAPVLGDDVSYVGGTALFSDKDVANGKVVTGTGLSLAGADAGNYTVNTTALTTANITPAPLTIQANDASKVEGQTFTPATTAFTVPVPPIAGEFVTAVAETSPGSPPAAGVAGSPYPINITPGSATGTFLPANYIITLLPGALTVTALPVVPPPGATTPIETLPIIVAPIVALVANPGPDLTVFDTGIRMPVFAPPRVAQVELPPPPIPVAPIEVVQAPPVIVPPAVVPQPFVPVARPFRPQRN